MVIHISPSSMIHTTMRALVPVLFMLAAGSTLHGQPVSWLVNPTEFRSSRPVPPMPIDSDPLEPGRALMRLGLEFVGGYITQSGTYASGCAEFDHGEGHIIGGGVSIDRLVGSRLRIDATLLVTSRALTSRFMRDEPVTLAVDGREPITTAVPMEHRSDASFTAIALQPSVRYDIIPQVFVGAGIELATVWSAASTYSRTITSPAIEVPGLGNVEYRFAPGQSSDPLRAIDAAVTRDDRAGTQLGAFVTAGIELPVAPRLLVTGRVQYLMPLTDLLESSDLRMTTIPVHIGIRYQIE